MPSRFYELVLGKRRKYSCCYWPTQVHNLNQAEEAMLRLTCERARLQNGMRVLDLGCGWGALALWMAEHYPDCEITALSNARTQGEFIRQQAERRGFSKLNVLTADAITVELSDTYDRILSVEMFEHMRNFGALLAKIAGWMNPKGKLFVHHFSHREFAYEFDINNPEDYMAQHYFAGGTMPSDDLLLYFQQDLKVQSHWQISGLHYGKTLRAWWNLLHSRRFEVEELFAKTYGSRAVRERFRHWQLFFLICEEMFNLKQGEEYLVSHWLFEKPA